MVNSIKTVAADANEAYKAYTAKNLKKRLRSPLYFDYEYNWRENADNYENNEAIHGGHDHCGPLIERIMTSVFDNSRDKAISLGGPENEAPMDVDERLDALNDWLGSDEDSDDSVRQLIAETAGLSDKAKGKQRERQVTSLPADPILTIPQCPRQRSTSGETAKEFISSSLVCNKLDSALDDLLDKFSKNPKYQPMSSHEDLQRNGWILDSGASQHFTMKKGDFIQYEEVYGAGTVKTAAKGNAIAIRGKGTVLLSHYVEDKGKRIAKVTRLYPVFHIPGLMCRLLSMGAFLLNEQKVVGDKRKIALVNECTRQCTLVVYPMNAPSTLHWVYLPKVEKANIALSSIFIINYEIWHKRFGHPSKEVLRRSKELVEFPRDLQYPEHNPVCPGCAEGKMHSKSFPDSPSRAQKPFDLVHSDLKEMPILSYSKYKYIVTFFDNCSSHAWVTMLRKKSETFSAFKHFHAMIKTQFNADTSRTDV